MPINYAALVDAVTNDAALRRRQTLQPIGGKGDKLFPPTYPEERRGQGPRHVFEQRRLNGEDIWCVLIDSVQSQANRLEESLLTAIREKKIDVPYVTVDFSKADLSGLTEITSLDAPHRVYDAILRDSKLGNEPFPKSELGRRLTEAKPNDATAVLEISPTALLFGAWHSTGEGGGIGAKFPRCLVSEITAINVPIEKLETRNGEVEVRTSGRRTGSRIDPLGVLRKVEVFKGSDGWDVSKEGAGKNAKLVRPSEINHGNIAPTVQALGITCDYAEHVAVISFAALRRLRFGNEARDRAARAFLAALGITALAEQDAQGYALRSRCDLVCEEKASWEIVHADGKSNSLELDRTSARALYAEARSEAEKTGFAFPREPIALVPQEKLVEIVRRSQKFALEGEGGESEDDV